MYRSQHPVLPGPYFFQCVEQAVAAIEDAVPEAIAPLDVNVVEVPDLEDTWSPHIPLSAAIEADDTRCAQVVVYRRPIEFRAASREQLRQLVFIAVVEQVSSITGLTVATLDPTNLRGETT